MAFQMRKATHDDIEELCHVYLEAFADEIFSRQVFPRGAESSMAYWRETLAEELDEPDATFLVLVDTQPPSEQVPASSTGTKNEGAGREVLAGFVKWVAPGAPPTVFSAEGYPPEGNPTVAAEYYKTLIDGHARHVGGSSYWYLDIMGVRPRYARRGGATQLMRWGFERAERDMMPCFVESSGPSQGLYEKFGFKVLETLHVDTPEGPAPMVFMLRGTRTE